MKEKNSRKISAAAPEHIERLKERFKSNGLKGFSSREALELLLYLAETAKDPEVLADSLVGGFGSLSGVLDAREPELLSMEGVDEDSFVLMDLIKNLPRSYGKDSVPAPTVISTKQEVLYHVNKAFPCRKGEQFLAIYLNSKNEVLGTWMLHEGSVSRATVTPRRAIEGAFHYNGQGVIFVHRHDRPSAHPTAQETELIKLLWSAASAVDLIVHDHLIFSRLGLYSALENGLISTSQENQSMAASPLIRNFFPKSK